MVTSITTWMSLINSFLSCFTEPGSMIFMELTIAWILCTTRHTVSGMLPYVSPESRRAHDAYHRFFPDGAWVMADLWQRLARLLVARLRPGGTLLLALDDTLFHHSGRHIDGAGWWRDAVRSTTKKVVHGWGLNLVVLTLQVPSPWGGEPLALPLNLRLHRKKGATHPDLAREMLREVVSWFPERRFHCVADGFYACLAGDPVEEVTLISRMRRDATLYDLPPQTQTGRRGRPRQKGLPLAKPPKLAEQADRKKAWQTVTVRERSQKRRRQLYSQEVVWYKVSKTPVRLVISRDPDGVQEDDFFVTNDLKMKPAQVIETFADRWPIEDTFKYVKQYLGGQHPQTYKAPGPERAAALSFWLYSMTWLWFLSQKPSQQAMKWTPWYPQKVCPSFADALSSLREHLWRERIKAWFGLDAVHDHNFEFLIQNLAAVA